MATATSPPPADPYHPAADAAIAAAFTLASVQATQALRNRLTGALRLLWGSLGAYRNAQMGEFITQAVPLVEAAMAQMASMTTGYLAAQSQAAGFSATPVRVPTPNIASVRGLPASEVYGRPFHLVWRELSQGVPFDKAVEDGLTRVEVTALTDVQLAKTHTVQAVINGVPVTAKPYWLRRVLEGPYSCGLCILASTQAYRPQDLLPIHPGCDCSVEPQWTARPKAPLNSDVVSAAHDAIWKQFGVSDPGGRRPDYRKLILVQDHGELGPVLTIKGHHFNRKEAANSGLDLAGVPFL